MGAHDLFHGARLIALFILAALFAGCAATGKPGSLGDVNVDPALLSGASLFPEPVTPSEAPTADMLDVNAPMREFLDHHVGSARSRAVRFSRLFEGLLRENYFSENYVAELTQTASQTFATKTGNCLSYSAMFVALAREAGLPVRFQLVDVPPTWDAEAGVLIRYTHINLLIEGVRLEGSARDQIVVDFNEVHPDIDYDTRVISDHYAQSLFHANRAVDHFLAGSKRLGFAHLAKALEMNPSNPDFWINLGAFYAREGQPRQAVQAYGVSHHLDPSSTGAIAGLARGYEQLGEHALAASHARRIRHHRDRNPFYHFAVARSHYEQARFEEALASINEAIGLKRRNPRFHFLKGLTETRLGDAEAARKSFRRAKRYGRYDDLKRRYLPELASANPKQVSSP